mmetsp:Transcript_10573/g.18749  ORF Transcript_10573/g.18749 Transcript_10573/m.18749 type:complete len:80 (+) Transcript_10573:2411-2650(+)
MNRWKLQAIKTQLRTCWCYTSKRVQMMGSSPEQWPAALQWVPAGHCNWDWNSARHSLGGAAIIHTPTNMYFQTDKRPGR